MTEKEAIEFRNLKFTRAKQGFWTPEQQERWNYLHKLQGQKILNGIKILEEKRMMRLN
jgi:hypothetical protein